MAIAMDKETVQNTFREEVLEALEGAAGRCFEGKHGAAKEDLPKLFKWIDAQVNRLCDRYDVLLADGLSEITAAE